MPEAVTFGPRSVERLAGQRFVEATGADLPADETVRLLTRRVDRTKKST